eukprot:TRINITY_DN3924_c1_g1_i1.p1 TRINITY_DN3924_c1_g1~~TRINITY_DN3924_c1_g1_i1.p1  ORF type:complete len:106 (-),score=6.18 TRINITY_DN3924_c1_g1_i1:633-950(-)
MIGRGLNKRRYVPAQHVLCMIPFCFLNFLLCYTKLKTSKRGLFTSFLPPLLPIKRNAPPFPNSLNPNYKLPKIKPLKTSRQMALDKSFSATGYFKELIISAYHSI